MKENTQVCKMQWLEGEEYAYLQEKRVYSAPKMTC